MHNSGGRKRGTGLGLLLVAVVGAGFLFLRSDFGQALLGGWSFVRSVSEDHGTYYRLKVKLTYKGEPQDFDIVVGCNVRVTTYKDSSTTYEVGLVPTVFGRRMSDGKALVVRPPSGCEGQTTENGRVARDLLPLVVVYDNPDTLSFGIAYLSEDAYESPLSVLKFGGATIEKATRAEFDEFRATQNNVVKRDLYYSTLNNERALKQFSLARVPGTWAYSCESYERFRIPNDLVALVQKSWPAERPEYWIADYQVEGDLSAAIRGSLRIQSDREDGPSAPWRQFGPGGDGAADRGLPTRTGRARIPAAHYPAANDFRLDLRPSDKKDWPNYVASKGKLAEMSIDFRAGSTKGFGYCYVRGQPGDLDFLSTIGPQRTLARIDGKDAATNRAGFGVPQWVFERDQYAFFYLQVYLGSPRGDV